MEFHAETTELVQLLKKGHYGVELDAEAWDRIVTWIDLNAPCHGSWSEFTRISGDQRKRRNEMQKLYCGREMDGEEIVEVPQPPIEPVAARPVPEVKFEPVRLAGWPFDATEASRRQAAAGAPLQMKLDLGETLTMDFTLIPAGEFVMGDTRGGADESPVAVVKIDRPFYLGTCEVTVEHYAAFDSSHDNGVISSFNKDQSTRGEIVHRPRQPVLRVSWDKAMAFCAWLSKRSGRRVTYALNGGED